MKYSSQFPSVGRDSSNCQSFVHCYHKHNSIQKQTSRDSGQITVCSCSISRAVGGNEDASSAVCEAMCFLSIMSKHVSFCGHFICSLSPHEGHRLFSKQWAEECHSLLHKKSNSHLDSGIYLSRQTRHDSGITC